MGNNHVKLVSALWEPRTKMREVIFYSMVEPVRPHLQWRNKSQFKRQVVLLYPTRWDDGPFPLNISSGFLGNSSRTHLYSWEEREMPGDKCLTEDSNPGLPILSLRTRCIRLSAWVIRQARDNTKKKTFSMGWDQESVKVSTPLPLPKRSIILSSLKISRHATPQRTPEDWR